MSKFILMTLARAGFDTKKNSLYLGSNALSAGSSLVIMLKT